MFIVKTKLSIHTYTTQYQLQQWQTSRSTRCLVLDLVS